MNQKLSEIIFRTRGLYMFVAVAASMIIKVRTGGATALPLFIIGLLIVAVVQAFRMYAASYLWGRQAVAKAEAEFMVTSGPFAYVRNPLYLGNFFIGIGLCVAVDEWYAYVLFIVSYVLVYSIVIPHEERFLQERFGDRYLSYKAQTGRLIPRLERYRGDDMVVPNYRAGVLGEIHVPIILGIIFLDIYVLFVK